MANDEPTHQQYKASLMNIEDAFNASSLGPVGPNPFGRLSGRGALNVLQLWKNNQLPVNHPIRILAVYHYAPDFLMRRHDPEESYPVWFITHLFKKDKESPFGPSRVVQDRCFAHWALKNKYDPIPITEKGNVIGYKTKLCLYVVTRAGKCQKTAYKMEEYSLLNNSDPVPPQPAPDHQGLYKYGDWIIVKLCKSKKQEKVQLRN